MSAPEADPSLQELPLRCRPQRVRRLRRNVIVGFASVAAVGIGVLVLLVFRQQEVKALQPPAAVFTPGEPQVVASLPASYEHPPLKAGTPVLGPKLRGDLGGVMLAHQRQGAPAAGTSRKPARANIASRLGQTEPHRWEHLRELPEDVMALRQEQPPILYDLVPQPVASPPSPFAHLSASPLADGKADAPAMVPAPTSPILLAGTIIPARLLTGIQSDLPGIVIAEITDNLRDSLHDNVLLVPQGSRLLGRYDHRIGAMQERVGLRWTRLIRPDGSSIQLDDEPGTDVTGQSGIADTVNYHSGRILKGAALATLVEVGAELGTGSDDELARAVRQGFQGTVSETARRVIDRQVDVPPTITVRPGTGVRLLLTRDLQMSVYEGGRE